VLLKYISSSLIKGKNIDIPSGEGLEKILTLINRYMCNKKKAKHRANDNYTIMSETNAFKLIESSLTDKVFMDIENKKNNIFIDAPSFIVDQLIMKFGLKTIAVKNLISLRLGLQNLVKKSILKVREEKGRLILLI
jgi:hypothetical protein